MILKTKTVRLKVTPEISLCSNAAQSDRQRMRVSWQGEQSTALPNHTPQHQLSTAAQARRPRRVGGWNRRASWAQEFETSLGNISPISREGGKINKKEMHCYEQWVPVKTSDSNTALRAHMGSDKCVTGPSRRHWLRNWMCLTVRC